LRLNPQNSIALVGTIALGVRSLDFDRVQRLTLAALENLSFEELKPVTTTVHSLRRTAISPSQMERTAATTNATATSSTGQSGGGMTPVAPHQVFSQALGQQPLTGFVTTPISNTANGASVAASSIPIVDDGNTNGGIGRDQAWPADPTGEEPISSDRYPIIAQIASYTQSLLPRYRAARASTTSLVAPLEGESHLFDSSAHRTALNNWSIISQASLSLSQLAYSAHLRGDTHLCLWLLARARLIEPRCSLAAAVSFIHHWRFSPLSVALSSLSSLFQIDPFFVIGIDLTCQSLCVRYPLESDRPFPRLLSTQLRHAPYISPLPISLALSAHAANPSSTSSSLGQYHPLHKPALPRSLPRKAGDGKRASGDASSVPTWAALSAANVSSFSSRQAGGNQTSLATTPTPLSRDSSTPRVTPPHSPRPLVSAGPTVVHTPLLAHAHLYATSYMTLQGSDKWPALIWYKEGLRLYQLHDTVGVLQCWSKAIEQTPDFSIALSYVLSLIEMAMTLTGEAAVAPLRAEFAIDATSSGSGGASGSGPMSARGQGPSRPITPSASGDLLRRGGGLGGPTLSAVAAAASSIPTSSTSSTSSGVAMTGMPSPRTSPRSIARRMANESKASFGGGGIGTSTNDTRRVLRPRPPQSSTSSTGVASDTTIKAKVDTGLGRGLRRTTGTASTPMGIPSKRSIAASATSSSNTTSGGRPRTGGHTSRGVGSRPQTPSAASSFGGSLMDDNDDDDAVNLNNEVNHAIEVPTRETLARLLGHERIHSIVIDVANRGKQLEHLYHQPELAYADYTLALLLLPNADVLWRRSLIAKRRNNTRAAFGDASMAILLTKQEQGIPTCLHNMTYNYVIPYCN
jgi:hypothetical protein